MQPLTMLEKRSSKLCAALITGSILTYGGLASATTITDCATSLPLNTCVLSDLIDDKSSGFDINGFRFDNFQEAFFIPEDHENIFVRAVDKPGVEIGLQFIPLPGSNPLSATSTGDLVSQFFVFEYDVTPVPSSFTQAKLTANFITTGVSFDTQALSAVSTSMPLLADPLRVTCSSPSCATSFESSYAELLQVPSSKFTVQNAVEITFDAIPAGEGVRRQSVTQFTSTFQVPVPSTIALLAFGFAGLGFLTRRRRTPNAS